MSTNIQTQVKITGLGACLPNEPVYNSYYASYLETSDEWIKTRTGIEARHLVTTQTLTDLAAEATKEALQNATLTAKDIDLIIVATTTADNAFPSCSTRLHGLLGMREDTQAFDIGAACNGFIYALDLARLFLTQPNIKNVAIIGADIMSNLLDKNDRSTVVLFGDGASCMILSKTNEKVGFIGKDFGTDGKGADLLYVTNKKQENSCIQMNGREIFIRAVKCMTKSLQNSIQSANLNPEDIDLIIPHQANIRIINAIQEKLGVPAEKVMKTLFKQGNTSAASIPLALYTAWKENKLQDKKNIALCGFGAGLSWGSIVMKIK